MTTNQIIRIIQVALVGFFGLYAALVTFGNVTDYWSNFDFVEGVLSMQATFEGNALMYRLIESGFMHHAGYLFIIFLELIITITCVTGSVQMLKNLKQDSNQFHEAKKWGFTGLLLATSVWFLGFQVIGGEWFAMWQSDTWNGLDSAFRLTTYILATIIILMLKEHENIKEH